MHPCSGCPRVTSRPGRCVACGGGTTTQRGYGADWQKRRAQQLRVHPTCESKPSSDARPCGGLATDVDHIVPKVHGGEDEPANLQSLCAAHHRAKTGATARRHGRAPGRRACVERRKLVPSSGAYESGSAARSASHASAQRRHDSEQTRQCS
jgi:hypothetical protein